MTAELVILAPLLVLVALVVVAFGRLERASAEVTDAARGAAQAAVVWPTTGQAYSAAVTTASYALEGDGLTCAPYAVSLDTSQWRPGGSVGVTVACTVSFAGVMFPGMPGSFTFHKTLSAPIETYRGLR